MTPAEVIERVFSDDPATARRELEALLKAQLHETGGHLAWGRALDGAGFGAQAFREFLLAVRDSPEDPEAMWALAVSYRERGDSRRAIGLLEQIMRIQPENREAISSFVELCVEEGFEQRARDALIAAEGSGAPGDLVLELGAWIRSYRQGEPETRESNILPSAEDVQRFLALFSGREGVHARQWRGAGNKVGYSPVHEPLTPTVVENHLLGNDTVGVYPVRADNTVRFFALDLDITKPALARSRQHSDERERLDRAVGAAAVGLARSLGELGLAPLLEDSGNKGRHLWVFFSRPEPARVVRNLGRLFTAEMGGTLPDGVSIEFFPKQAAVREGKLGNLIKLPLGIHRLSGRRCDLLDEEGKPLAEPYGRLAEVSRVETADLHTAIRTLKSRGLDRPDAEPDPPGMSTEATAPAPAEETAEEFSLEPVDLDEAPEAKHLFSCCPVLAGLRSSVEGEFRLSYEEQLVLRFTMGHLADGARLVNHLLSLAVDVGPEAYLTRRLSGNPMSCPRIRQRVPHLTAGLDCACSFPLSPDRYPTPLLHLVTLPREQSTGGPGGEARMEAEDQARAYAALLKESAGLAERLVALRSRLASTLKDLPDRKLRVGDSVFVLRSDGDGVDEVQHGASGAAGEDA